MERRKFIQQTSFMLGGTCLIPTNFNLSNKKSPFERFISTDIKQPDITFPPKKRIPLGWKAFPVGKNQELTYLSFNNLQTKSEKCWLRITAAIDFRQEKIIEVVLPDSGEKIAVFDIRYAHPFQPFEVAIDKKYLKQIKAKGIGLKQTKGDKDAWFFMPDGTIEDNKGLQPQLLVGDSSPSVEVFQQNLLSMNSFSPFGWMGGCVIDALFEMSKKGDKKATKTLEKQLGCLLDKDKGIIFESPVTEPKDGSFNSIEDFLPFAAIVDLYPDHPSIQMALDFLKTKEKENGLIVSGNHITTEGCYTVAYPLACIAVQRNSKELAEKAIKQITFRTKYLVKNQTIFQRASIVEDKQGFGNWGRGSAWYLLGTAKTIAVLKNSNFKDLPGIAEMEKDLKEAMEWVVNYQSEEGFWRGFIDQKEAVVDTSTTGGIASAIVWGCKTGTLPQSLMTNARKANKIIPTYLTPDGFITHVSQINRGGEALQESAYRVISQFGMGLMAQLESGIV